MYTLISFINSSKIYFPLLCYLKHYALLMWVLNIGRKQDKDGVPLAFFRDLIEKTVGFHMDRCQWEGLVRRIRLKNECKVDAKHFLSYISKESVY